MNWINYLLFFAIVISCTHHENRTPAQNKKNKFPNVIIFYTDDMGYSDVAYATKVFAPSAWVEKLAKTGVSYKNFYSASSICSPARASLLTGKFPPETKVTKALFPHAHHGFLENKEITLAELFKEAGHKSAFIGKWHVGDGKSARPIAQGFDYFKGILHSHDIQKGRVKYWENEKIIEENAEIESILKGNIEYAEKFINENKNENFFMMFSTPLPHVPLPKNYSYQDTLFHIDQDLGRIVRALKKEKIYEKTIIVFASDNGPWVPKGRKAGESWPLRGTKGSSLEGGFRVPMIISWPERISNKKYESGLVSGTDFFSTFIDLLSLNNELEKPHSSISFLKSLTLGRSTARAVFPYYGTDGELEAKRVGNWKYSFEEEKLYHLKTDPGEVYDLSLKHQNLVKLFKANNIQKILSYKDDIETPPEVDLRKTIINKSNSPMDIFLKIDWKSKEKIEQNGIYYSARGGHRWSIAEDLVYQGNLSQLENAIKSGFDINQKVKRFGRAFGATGKTINFSGSFVTLAALMGRVDFIRYIKEKNYPVKINQKSRPLKHLAIGTLEDHLTIEIQKWKSFLDRSDEEVKGFYQKRLNDLEEIKTLIY